MEPPLRITLLAQTAAGWARLCRLLSAAHAEAGGALPVVSWPVLRAYADRDLVVLLGLSSEPVRALSADRPDVAERLLAPWRELAGEQPRLEAVYLGRQGTDPGSLRLAARTVGLADQVGVRTILTNAVRYADPSWLSSDTRSNTGQPRPGARSTCHRASGFPRTAGRSPGSDPGHGAGQSG